MDRKGKFSARRKGRGYGFESLIRAFFLWLQFCQHFKAAKEISKVKYA